MRRRVLSGLQDWLAASFRQHRGNADVVRQELQRVHGVVVSLRTDAGWRRRDEARCRDRFLRSARAAAPAGRVRGGRWRWLVNPTDDSLLKLLARLQLTALRDQLDTPLDEAARRDLNLREGFTFLCQAEVARREQRRLEMAARLAKFPFARTLDGFDFEAQRFNGGVWAGRPRFLPSATGGGRGIDGIPGLDHGIIAPGKPCSSV